MLSLIEVRAFRGFLLSDRVTIKGTEHLAFSELLGILNREEMLANAAVRVTPAAAPQPPAPLESKPEEKTPEK